MKFMIALILKGYTRESTSALEAGKCWYLPHHGVYPPPPPQQTWEDTCGI